MPTCYPLSIVDSNQIPRRRTTAPAVVPQVGTQAPAAGSPRPQVPTPLALLLCCHSVPFFFSRLRTIAPP